MIQSHFLRGDEVAGLKKLYIEPTSNCNLSCAMCFRSTWFDESFSDMPFSLFQKILSEIPETVETVFFGGMGEPLFHENIIEMVRMTAPNVKAVELLTNGTLLTEDMSENLLRAGLTKLWISIDTLIDSNSQEKGHNQFKKVTENIKLFNKVRYHRYDAKLGIAFVAMKSNVRQLAGLPAFLSTFKIDDVNISNIYPSDSDAEKEALYMRTVNMGIGADKEGRRRSHIDLPYMDWDIDEVVIGLSGLFAKLDSTLSFGNVPVFRRIKHCRFVDEGMAFIRSDGDVSPCMALLHNGTTSYEGIERKISHHSFGNVKDKKLSDIWNSDDYTAFRKRIEEFDFSPCVTCGHCISFAGNADDCFGNFKPACGGCLWAEGVLSCP